MRDSYLAAGTGRDRPHWAVFLIAAGLVVTLALKAGDIFAGRLPGNDDLLRLQQIRDLLGGQAWFNVDQMRFLTPEGGEMHWSRLPDLFPAALIWLTSPVLGQANAEALAAVVWPLVLLCIALYAITLIMRRLEFNIAAQVLGLLFFGVSAAIYNFWPGRLDHHALVVVLSLLALAAILSPQMTARSAMVAAFAITAMVSIAIESLPYAGVLIMALGLSWIVRGHREAQRLTLFGLTLAVCALIFYIGDAPGWGPRRMVCDAYGQSHLAGLLGGGVLLAILGIFGSQLIHWRSRLIAGALSGVAILALIVLVQPDCLGDPYAEVSDQVRLAWLSAVGEARAMTRIFSDDPEMGVQKFGFVLAGLTAAGIMIWKAPTGQRLGRAILGLAMLVSALATVWQIRGTTFSHVFASIACAWLVGSLALHWFKQRGTGPVLALFVAAALASPMGWNMIARPFSQPEPFQTGDKPYRVICIEPDAYAALPTSPDMRIFTPIDLGMSALLRTPHSVFAGPYHRNVKGIERVTDVFMGPPEEANDKLANMGATHLLYCQGLPETVRYSKLRPESFAALMETGNVPGWLEPMDEQDETDGTVRLYRIDTSGLR